MFEGCLSREESERYNREEKEQLKKELQLALELIKIHHRDRICPHCNLHIEHGAKHAITCKLYGIDMKARILK